METGIFTYIFHEERILKLVEKRINLLQYSNFR